jgi:iron(III) transport system substrate-binding protein
VWLILVAAFPALLMLSERSRQQAVVVYVSQDQVYAEPILKDFERQTGIKVRAVYDSEAVKTVGLANRLLAEQAHPQADVFWGNEELRTRQLTAKAVFREPDPWRAFGYRSRRIVVNTNRLALAVAPRSLSQLTNETWRGKVALAYPLFGTTATHFVALRQHWGEARWLAWCRALQANQPFLVDGNSVVVRLVGKGEAWLGLTDSDDVAAGQREGYPLAALPLTEESLLIPNTVAVVRGARHPAEAQRLADHLASPEVAAKLVTAHALEGASAAAITARTLQPDWEALLRDLDEATTALREIFLRWSERSPFGGVVCRVQGQRDFREASSVFPTGSGALRATQLARD